jgi:phospholipid/cholesterol/gamma-HCH transport system substrate-binding protein
MTATSARRARRWAALAAASLLATSALSGCKFQGAASIPLPGGVGGDGYQVKIEFTDVLDLVPQSAVKVNDVTVGTVKKIELSASGYTAVVTVSIRKDVTLPSNATAELRQTSLLGEKFVSLDKPASPSSTLLRAGDYIGLTSTKRNADIEEVLGALSLVLNGGSLEQLQVINSELTKALKGRETDVRAFLRQLTGFVGGLDKQKTQIVHALDGLDRLSGKLAAERQVLDVALRDIPKGTAVLADERAQLTRVLSGLNNLGTVATRVITATQQNTVADLQALQPILGQLAKAGKDLPNALELLTTYPFPRTVSLPGGKGGIRGDYANLYVTIDGNPQDLIDNLTPVNAPVTLSPTSAGTATTSGTPGATVPRSSGLPLVGALTIGQGDLALLLFAGLS